ncbi:hypothetical protein JW707_05260 [Candidatus Woesearchaeota archaeon]|nr:hypothetical protein [Candidatus Woesearchaeota archaeon]
MADPDKKSPRKPASAKTAPEEAMEEEYELLPHKEIVELKDELRRLKSLPPEAGKHAEVSYDVLTRKMDRLIEIFEEAEKSVEVEEGAMTFKERMAPFMDKMNKVLEQNSEIAEGIVALADIMNEIKDKLEVGVIYRAKEAEKSREAEKPRPEFPKPLDFGSPMPPPRPSSPMPFQGMPPPGMPPFRTGGPLPPLPGAPKQEGMAPPPLPRMGAPLPRPGPMPPPPQQKKGMFGKK